MEDKEQKRKEFINKMAVDGEIKWGSKKYRKNQEEEFKLVNPETDAFYEEE